jgi:hypothetical protein
MSENATAGQVTFKFTAEVTDYLGKIAEMKRQNDDLKKI